MTYDGSNRKHIRQAEKAQAIADNERRLYVAHIMSTIAGRAWMHQFLSQCSIFSTPFVASAYDVTAFKCGAQNVGLQVFADVHLAAPREYVLMMSEASQKEVANERRYSDERTAPGQPAGSSDTGRDVEGSVDSDYDPYARVEGDSVN